MLPDARVRPDDAADHLGFLLDDHVTADYGIWTDHGTRFDLRTTVDEGRWMEFRPVFDSRVGSDHRLVAALVTEPAAVELSVEHVSVHLHVLLRCADVDPVAAIDIRIKPFA